MTLQLPTLRAAENFSRALDGTAEPTATDRYAALLDTVAALRSLPEPTPRQGFVTTLREQLMTAAETELVAASPAVPTQSRHRERRLAAAAAAFVLVGTTAGVATAAEQALPGSTFYPIKRGIESAQITMTTNETAKGRELLSQAGTRLDEVDALLSGGPDATTEQLANTLESFSERAAQGSDLLFRSYQRDARPADISAVRDFAASSMDSLDRIAELAPPTSTGDFSQAAMLLAEIDQQARSLCDDCSTAGALAAPASLVSPHIGDALANLVSGPALAAQPEAQETTTPEQIAAGARAAEAAAGNISPGGSSPAPESGTGSTAPDSKSMTDPATSPVSNQQPVKSIVDSVTTGLLPKPVKHVTHQLTDPLKPVTDLVDDKPSGVTAP